MICLLPSFSIIHNPSSPLRVAIIKLLKPRKFVTCCSSLLHISSVNKTFPRPKRKSKFSQLNQNFRNLSQLSTPELMVWPNTNVLFFTLRRKILWFSNPPRTNTYETSSPTRDTKPCRHALTLKMTFDLSTTFMPYGVRSVERDTIDRWSSNKCKFPISKDLIQI